MWWFRLGSQDIQGMGWTTRRNRKIIRISRIRQFLRINFFLYPFGSRDGFTEKRFVWFASFFTARLRRQFGKLIYICFGHHP